MIDDQSPPERWIDHIPAPDPDGAGDQDLYTHLVTALADWRGRYHVTDPADPLGPQPHGAAARTEWHHLTQALHLYQQARITDRLERIRARRSADRARLEAATRDAAGRPAHPRAPCRPRPATTPGEGRAP